MIYQCADCGATLEGISYPPMCPFCKKPFDGQGTEQLLKEAEAFRAERKFAEMAAKLSRAAEAGNTEAAYLYGMALERGEGVRVDVNSAVGYYKYAASRAHVGAAARLGIIYYDHFGDKQHPSAMFWLTVAAEGGDPDAAARVAAEAEGDDAFYYYTVAALGGNKKAAATVTELILQEGGDNVFARAKGFYLLSGTQAVKLAMRYPKLLTVAAMAPTLPLRNEAEAAFRVGSFAELQKEYYLALTFFGRAVSLGYAAAATRIGTCYLTGKGVPKSRTAAAKWFVRGVDEGDPEAMIALGEMFLSGTGVEKDEKKAFFFLSRCASQGHPRAQFMAAEMQFEGKGTARDIPAAMALYEKSAAQGYKPAIEKRDNICKAVGSFYNKALKAFKNGSYEEAVRGYTIAAEMGHSGAIANLGYCYQNGYGCKRDLKRALAYYRRAVMYGKSSARFNLGLCYMTNSGVRFDASRAEDLLRGSGHPEAERLIAEMKERKEKKLIRHLYSVASVLYRKGKVSEALALRTAAAGKGSKEAMCLIGCHYEFGMGAPRDMETARRFYWQSGFSLSEIDRLKRGFLKTTVEVKKRGFV